MRSRNACTPGLAPNRTVMRWSFPPLRIALSKTNLSGSKQNGLGSSWPYICGDQLETYWDLQDSLYTLLMIRECRVRH